MIKIHRQLVFGNPAQNNKDKIVQQLKEYGFFDEKRITDSIDTGTFIVIVLDPETYKAVKGLHGSPCFYYKNPYDLEMEISKRTKIHDGPLFARMIWAPGITISEKEYTQLQEFVSKISDVIQSLDE